MALPDRKDPGYLPSRDPSVMTARDVLSAVRTYGDESTLPATPAASPLYELIDRAEAQAMGPLSAVSLRELAMGRNPDPRTPNPGEAGNGNPSATPAPGKPSPGPA